MNTKEEQTETGSEKGPESNLEARKIIGRAIIDGLLTSVGGFVPCAVYAQKGGNYDQTGGTHTQGFGDYKQRECV